MNYPAFFLPFFLFCCLHASAGTSFSINFLLKKNIQQLSGVSISINDAINLLEQACNCNVTINGDPSTVNIHFPDNITREELFRLDENSRYPYPKYQYPNHAYSWQQKTDSTGIHLYLSALTPQGVSCGIYGLLQEKLGFAFYHPRNTLIPDLNKWPLKEDFNWNASPRFEKKGFHLHTMHPIELTEPLHNPDHPKAWEMTKEYIDWLARNGQNYFEYNLLESVDLDDWLPFAKKMTDYLHQRGIIAGIDLSMHMIQQKAFKLYRNFPASWRTKKKQILRMVERLAQAGFDVWNVEFDTAEFLAGNQKKKTKLRLILNEALQQKGIRLMGREHVVKPDKEKGKKKKEIALTSEQQVLDSHRGVLIHTVMCYSISEEKAPVYENENLRHMLEMLLEEKEKRETWYYPESAYWVTFDNSIPLFLLPYLSARLEDIQLMDSLQIPGHITFSSGWEWGYWLIDWSIARWSWQHEENGITMKNKPLEYLTDLVKGDVFLDFIHNNLKLQQTYLKDKNLMQYMVAQSPTDELPGPFNIEFHPRPDWRYKWLRNKAPMDSLKKVENTALRLLKEFYTRYDVLEKGYSPNQEKTPIQEELLDALKMVRNRAEHRYYTLKFIIESRKEEILKNHDSGKEALMEQAAKVRTSSMEIVRNREAQYRYPIDLLARRYKSHTAYDYGYLFSVSKLHFWKREELQGTYNKWGAFYHNIFDMWRIIGLKN